MLVAIVMLVVVATALALVLLVAAYCECDDEELDAELEVSADDVQANLQHLIRLNKLEALLEHLGDVPSDSGSRNRRKLVNSCAAREQ